ncbi:MAG TPA: thioesterase family protein [Solirubrobacteraceae bacterium]|jgi:acyl-CoA thioester hydrolase
MIDLEIVVRWQDLDALGHVNHAVYLTYLEEQRDRWLSQRLGLGGRDYVVASTQIDYESAIEAGDSPVSVSGVLERIGSSSLTIAADVSVPSGRRCARSRTTIVLWDAGDGRSRPLTARERDALHGDLGPSVDD